MGKTKTQYICQECGYISLKWLGKCPECGTWQSMVEEIIEETKKLGRKTIVSKAKPVRLGDVKLEKEERFTTQISELDLVLGGGVVKGSLVLVGGNPGIGKSTLLLQVANHMGKAGSKVLYVSGEESIKQTKIRAERLGVGSTEVYLLAENDMDVILNYVEELKPDFLIVDSIQTVYNRDISSAPGSVSQVREATNSFMKLSKGDGIATFIVGHVTKSGTIAGPKVLEHMVDTVLYFEGEKHSVFRVLRAVKNRFGSTNELGIFEMTHGGLKEVLNPSQLFVANRPHEASGSVIVGSMEGTRPILVEIQALASQTSFGTPRRMAVGLDYNRTVMLLAVLEKKIGMQFQHFDAFINVVGGMQLGEPAIDLAVAAALASSLRNEPIEESMVVFGEVGLTGEIRAVNFAEKRILEASKMGFKKVVMPKGNLDEVKYVGNLELVGAETLEEAFKYLFGR